MLKQALCTLGAAALALLPTPALAQDDADAAAMEQFAAFGEMFDLEPLTPEQEARLPLARELMRQVLPDGAMQEMIASTFDGVMSPLIVMANADATAALNGVLGYRSLELGLDEAAAEEVLAITDPSWRERNEATNSAAQAMVLDTMTRMEPVMRNVMAELYAINFHDTQLADIAAFYATPSGEAFARQSYTMAGDPRIMAAMFSEPELIFGPMMEMPAALEEATASLPAVRSFADLSAEEKARLTELTGFSKEELEAAMNVAAESQSF